MDLPCRVSFSHVRRLGKNLKWKYDNVLSTVAFMHVNVKFKVRFFFVSGRKRDNGYLA